MPLVPLRFIHPYRALLACGVTLAACSADTTQAPKDTALARTAAPAATTAERASSLSDDTAQPAPPSEEEPGVAPCTAYAFSEDWPELRPLPAEGGLQVLLCPTEADARAQLSDNPDPAPTLPPQADFAALTGQAADTRDGMALYRHAVDTLSRGARLTPLLLFRAPGISPAQAALVEGSTRAQRDLKAFHKASGIGRWRALQTLIGRYKSTRPLLRALTMREGMVYFDDPLVAQMAYRRLRVDHFFGEDEETIYLRRGDAIYTLKRNGDDYLFQEGDRKGERARLVLWDRLALKREALDAPVGWDLEPFRKLLGLRSFKVEAWTKTTLEGAITARRGERLKAWAMWRGGVRTLILEVAPDKRDAVTAMFERDRHDHAIAQGILRAGEAMTDERLRFDEPRNEVGQEDGMLRIAWERAYLRGASWYGFRGHSYPVFTSYGKPATPQVCIDFVVDAPERWSGRWWASKGEPPKLRDGFLDFTGLVTHRRRVRSIIEFAQLHPDKADLLSFPDSRRVQYRRRDDFYAMVRGLNGEVLEGDIMVIYGLRDDGRNHFHSFYVRATDPMDNVPILLMGNAGVARLQTWDSVMRTAPLRSLYHRIRLRPEWIAKRRAAFKAGTPPQETAEAKQPETP